MTTRIIKGGALENLRALRSCSVQTSVSSPPYYGLRDYKHPDQIGLEPTVEEYIEKLVDVYREVRRILRDDGTCWINIGDSYAAGGRGTNKHHSAMLGVATAAVQGMGRKAPPPGYKPKDLLLIPAQLALALRKDGWYVRNRIVWAKTNNMPESVTDRCTRSHEDILLLTKREQYYYDHVAIMEDAVGMPSGNTKRKHRQDRGGPASHGGHQAHSIPWDGSLQRNKRDVWVMSTVPLKEAHFAAFPPELPETCILAGSAARACPVCLTPYTRLTLERSIDRTELPRDHPEWRPRNYTNGKKEEGELQPAMGDTVKGKYRSIKTIGWQPSCEHLCTCDHPPTKCTVLDPFAGSGTTGIVAEKLGRDAILIELNPEWAGMSDRRVTDDNPLFNQTTTE